MLLILTVEQYTFIKDTFFSDSSSTVFSSNTTTGGGAIYSVDNRFANVSPDPSTKFNSHIYFQSNRSTKFNNNFATFTGGGIHCSTCSIFLRVFLLQCLKIMPPI